MCWWDFIEATDNPRAIFDINRKFKFLFKNVFYDEWRVKEKKIFSIT